MAKLEDVDGLKGSPHAYIHVNTDKPRPDFCGMCMYALPNQHYLQNCSHLSPRAEQAGTPPRT